MSSVSRYIDIDLRIRILQESFKMKPVYESYKNLCRDIGDTRLTFEVFEYWFYGFTNNQFFLDHEASSVPASRMLNDLPHDVLSKVLGYIDKSDRSNLSKVSGYFKSIVDESFPSYEEIKVTLRRGFISVKYDEKCREYKKADTGCMTVINGKDEIVDEDYLTVFMEHFSAAIQNDLKKLHIDAHQMSEEHPLDPIDFERFTRLMRTLKKPNNQQPLNIQVIHLIGMKLDVSCHIMSLAKPGLLHTIAIWSSYKTDNYEPIYKKMVGMEQWRLATALSLIGNGESSVDEFIHAQQFQLEKSKMSPGEIFKLREKLFKHKSFTYCDIKFPPSYDFTEIKTALGARNKSNDKWYFPIPNSLQSLEFSFGTTVNGLFMRIARIN